MYNHKYLYIFIKVGKSLAISILDLSNLNPNSRLENSEFKSLTGLRELLRANIISDSTRSRLGSKSTSNINVDTPMTSKQVHLSLYLIKLYFYYNMLLEKHPFQASFF